VTGLGLAVVGWLAGAAGALVPGRRGLAERLAVAGAVAGCAAATITGSVVLWQGQREVWSTPWTLPVGALAVRLDPLTAVFLLPVGVVGGLCAAWGWAYLGRHGHGRAWSYGLYNLLLASMALVVVANDLLLLLLAWEVMTLSSWGLVVSDHAEADARAAGLVYLAAAHVATAALLAFVLLLSTDGNFQVDALRSGSHAGALFVLAVVGFGTKAGVFPLHVWLPDAHPAAPSHVSALMSAVMITMGFYGLARFLPLIGPAQAWWGYLLITLGVLGALGGIAFALAQRDVKRILAYSTVENAGIVSIALGVGVLGSVLGQPALAGAGWSAGLLHLWNHALAKGAIFLGIGAVAQAAGTRQLDALGGMLRGMRLVGAAVIVLAAAMAALPGMNLFTSEWLLLNGLLAEGAQLEGAARVILLACIAVLAMAGALAVACFARLAGVGLLGSPRTNRPFERPGVIMSAPIIALALGCVVIALLPATTAGILDPAVRIASPAADTGFVQASLGAIGWLLPALITGGLMLLGARRLVSRRLRTAAAGTWACGYSAPTPAMQYTSMSFSEPLVRTMQPLLATERLFEAAGAPGVWPARMSWSSRSRDRVWVDVYLRALSLIQRWSVRVRALQKPRVTTSLLYIVLVVLLLLALLFLPGSRA
jgi:formate hydrogenlyase subunit 3/multisubunit Na+/H+ antiporter MnhD subunit